MLTLNVNVRIYSFTLEQKTIHLDAIYQRHILNIRTQKAEMMRPELGWWQHRWLVYNYLLIVHLIVYLWYACDS
jgi:hypothetical protein